METPIILALIGIVSAIVGSSWISSLMFRKKYTQELENLKADVAKKNTGTKGIEIENAEKMLKMQVDYIVEPLKKEIGALRKTVNKLQRAVNKIGDCSHADLCPIRHELQSDTDENGGKVES